MKVELPTLSNILLSYPTLTPTIFIANMFHTIAEASSIIFNLHRQFFADTKSFESERLQSKISLPVAYPVGPLLSLTKRNLPRPCTKDAEVHTNKVKFQYHCTYRQISDAKVLLPK